METKGEIGEINIRVASLLIEMVVAFFTLTSKKLKVILAVLTLISLILASTFVVTKTSFGFNKKWSIREYSTLTEIVDLNSDGLVEILIGLPSEETVICCNYQGKENWRFPTRMDPETYSSDINNDSVMEVIVVSSFLEPFKSSLVTCLDSNGKYLWEIVIDFDKVTILEILDCNSDGSKDIILAGEKGVYILDEEGTITNFIEIENRNTPLLIDHLNDKIVDFVFLDGHSFLCYDINGSLQWNYTLDIPGVSFITATKPPVVLDYDKNGSIDIFYFYNANFYEGPGRNEYGFLILDSSGNETIKYDFYQEHLWIMRNSLIVDIQDDGILEIVFTSSYNEVFCYTLEGVKLWSNDEYKSGHCCPNHLLLFVDFLGDEKKELADIHEEEMYCFNSNGEIIKQIKVLEDIYFLNAILDLDYDSKYDIIAESDASEIFCYSFEGVIEEKISQGNQYYSIVQNIRSQGSPGYSRRLKERFVDQDGDSLSDFQEKMIGSSPLVADLDSDGFLDGWEYKIGLNPLIDESNMDFDNDGLSNFDEIFDYHTSIFSNDSDSDGTLDKDDKFKIQKPDSKVLYFIPSFILSVMLLTLIVSNSGKFSLRRTRK